LNVLVVLAHPERGSFNSALCEAAVAEVERLGHRAEVSDLYAMRFAAAGGRDDFAVRRDPDHFHYQSEQLAAAHAGTFVPAIAAEQDKLRRADILILQFPLWWGGPPAILKGWIDRVCAYGVTYADGTRFDAGLFRGRRAMLSVTTGGTPHRFSDAGGYGPIDKVLWPVQHLFLAYLGYEVVAPQVCYGAARLDPIERARYLDSFRQRTRNLLADLPPPPPVPTPHEIAELVGERDWTSKV